MKYYRYFRDATPPGTRKLRSNDIILKVCEYFGHPVEFVMSKSRKKEFVRTRYIMAYLLAQDFYLNMSLTSIAFAIGKRDHTTIIHGLQIINNELEIYQEFRELVCDVFEYVYGSDAYFPLHLKEKMTEFNEKVA